LCARAIRAACVAAFRSESQRRRAAPGCARGAKACRYGLEAAAGGGSLREQVPRLALRAAEEEKELGEGETTASFHVDATGKIDKVTIDKTTSEAHAEAVKRILAAVKVTRPPGGGMDVGQTFKFH